MEENSILLCYYGPFCADMAFYLLGMFDSITFCLHIFIVVGVSHIFIQFMSIHFTLFYKNGQHHPIRGN